jgi:hypothetical protein
VYHGDDGVVLATPGEQHGRAYRHRGVAMLNDKGIRPGATTLVAPGGTAAPAAGPGKRTLTEALSPAPSPSQPASGGASPAPVQRAPVDGGVPDGTSSDAGQQAAPGQPAPQGGKSPPPVANDPPTGSKDMVALVVEARGQKVQVYVSPGGINHTPDVFMFFHGYYANLGIDSNIKPKDDDNASGEDTAAAAMKQAKAPNTLAMLPQGVRGDQDNDGGRMDALKPQNKQERKDKNTFPLFLDEILVKVAKELKITGAIAPNHIALAGHSAGGYKGVYDALTEAGGYDDKITDITLMDSSYSPSHFAATSDWMFRGSPGKTVRIVQSAGQLDHGSITDPDDPEKKKKKRVAPWHKKYFGEKELDGLAKTHKMTTKPLSAGEDRGNDTKVVQHTQVLTASGTVQCDVLIMQSDLGHHEIRDNVLDDAIDSIGQGAQGNVDFGKNQIPDYGRDPALPNAGNTKPKPPAPPAKPPKNH